MSEYIQKKDAVTDSKNANLEIMTDYGPVYGTWGFTKDKIVEFYNILKKNVRRSLTEEKYYDKKIL